MGLGNLKMIKESSSPALDADKIEVPSPKDENNSSNSEAATDNEDFEISDDDDDDRNHKHRAEARPQSFDENTEQSQGSSEKDTNFLVELIHMGKHRKISFRNSRGALEQGLIVGHLELIHPFVIHQLLWLLALL